MDVVTAFLNGEVSSEVNVGQPKGYSDGTEFVNYVKHYMDYEKVQEHGPSPWLVPPPISSGNPPTATDAQASQTQRIRHNAETLALQPHAMHQEHPGRRRGCQAAR